MGAKSRQRRLADKKRRKAKRRIEVLKNRKNKPSAPKTNHIKPPETKEDPPGVSIDQLRESTFNWPERMLMDLGQALHDGRKVSPVAESEAPTDATYDDRVGITYSPIDIETCGYHITANPRRVGVREVAALADKSCKCCHGVGYWKTTKTQNAGLDEFGRKVIQDFEYEQSCDCADQAFKEKHKATVLVDSQFGEWIFFEDLVFEKLLDVKVEGVDDGVQKVQGDDSDDEHSRTEGVSELPEDSER